MTLYLFTTLDLSGAEDLHSSTESHIRKMTSLVHYTPKCRIRSFPNFSGAYALFARTVFAFDDKKPHHHTMNITKNAPEGNESLYENRTTIEQKPKACVPLPFLHSCTLVPYLLVSRYHPQQQHNTLRVSRLSRSPRYCRTLFFWYCSRTHSTYNNNNNKLIISHHHHVHDGCLG